MNPAEHGETRQGRPRFPMPCHRWIVHPRESDFFPLCLRSIFHGRSAEGVTHFLGGCGLYSLASTRREEMLGEGSGTAGWGLITCRHPTLRGSRALAQPGSTQAERAAPATALPRSPLLAPRAACEINTFITRCLKVNK